MRARDNERERETEDKTPVLACNVCVCDRDTPMCVCVQKTHPDARKKQVSGHKKGTNRDTVGEGGREGWRDGGRE